jgi:hypothetical protein
MKFKILLIIFLATACYEVQRDCNAFRTGTFKSEIILNEVLLTSTFKRSESLQVESFKGQVDSVSVRWINDCEMIFKTINPKTLAEKKDIHLKILNTTDNAYNFEYGYVGEANKQEGTARRLD